MNTDETFSDISTTRTAQLDGIAGSYRVRLSDNGELIRVGHTNQADKGRDACRMWVADGTFSSAGIWYQKEDIHRE